MNPKRERTQRNWKHRRRVYKVDRKIKKSMNFENLFRYTEIKHLNDDDNDNDHDHDDDNAKYDKVIKICSEKVHCSRQITAFYIRYFKHKTV